MEGKAKRVGREQELEGYWVPLAEGEDGWDEVLERCCGLVRTTATTTTRGGKHGEGEREAKWVDVYKQALWDVRRAVKETERGNRELARKMTDLAEKEQVLADKERDKRMVAKEVKRAERRAARAAWESAGGSGEGQDGLSPAEKCTT